MTDHDHAADTCPYPWCQAHRMCECAYSDQFPHRAAGCRHAPEPDGDLRNPPITEGQKGDR